MFTVISSSQLQPARGVVVDSRLVIVSTVPADTGVYICNASNSQGFDTASAHLTVIGKLFSKYE